MPGRMDAQFERLSDLLIEAVASWPAARQQLGRDSATARVDTARAALLTYATAVERAREKPTAPVVVRIPRGAPRLRPTLPIRARQVRNEHPIDPRFSG